MLAILWPSIKYVMLSFPQMIISLVMKITSFYRKVLNNLGTI